eukprot:TRINITY_DN4198_c1_g2_i2.p1 TRINITY_DN4198_c1_g2~~TRINITY_DN4198_c1_g2_i2.p1  ORF type:complete len:500 (+),score=140.47 TRINITY_DN4198_c1_g2_i2:86-1501(+)
MGLSRRWSAPRVHEKTAAELGARYQWATSEVARLKKENALLQQRLAAARRGGAGSAAGQPPKSGSCSVAFEPARPQCINGDAPITPRRVRGETAAAPSASTQGNTPTGSSAATASANPERRCPVVLEPLEHPASVQAAAVLAEVARCKARAEIAAEAQRLERQARLRDEAAHAKERERLVFAADELQEQLAALRAQSEASLGERRAAEALRGELAASRREAAAASAELRRCSTLLGIEREAARMPAAEQHARCAIDAQEVAAAQMLAAALAAGPKRKKQHRKRKQGKENTAPPCGARGGQGSCRMTDEEVLNIDAIAHRVAEYVPVEFARLCSSMARKSYTVTNHQFNCWVTSLQWAYHMQAQRIDRWAAAYGPPVIAKNEFARFEMSIHAWIRIRQGPVELLMALRRRVLMVQLIFHEFVIRFEDLYTELQQLVRKMGPYNNNLLEVLQMHEARTTAADPAAVEAAHADS